MTAPTPAVNPATDPATPAVPAPVATAPVPATTPTPVDTPANPWDDPKVAQAEIEKLRKENGAARTTAKAQAADEARNELAQSIGKVLGIVKDDAPVDPVKLTEQLTAQTTAARQAQVELAVFRNADAAKGDPLALLDSRNFLAKLKDIDPADSAAVVAAMTAAIAETPRLGSAPGTRLPAPNPALGAGASGAAPDIDSQIAEATKAGNYALAIALKRQRAYAQTT